MLRALEIHGRSTSGLREEKIAVYSYNTSSGSIVVEYCFQLKDLACEEVTAFSPTSTTNTLIRFGHNDVVDYSRAGCPGFTVQQYLMP